MKTMNEFQEYFCDQVLTPLLEIAEGKRPIDEWNTYAQKAMELLDTSDHKTDGTPCWCDPKVITVHPLPLRP